MQRGLAVCAALLYHDSLNTGNAEEARGLAHNRSPERLRRVKKLAEHSRKDGYTVKKLIALFLAVMFVCGTVGCGGEKTTPKAPAASNTGGGK